MESQVSGSTGAWEICWRLWAAGPETPAKGAMTTWIGVGTLLSVFSVPGLSVLLSLALRPADKALGGESAQPSPLVM